MGGPHVKKPIRHRNVEEWQRKNNKLSLATEKGAEMSTSVRFSSQQLRSEAQNRIHWNREDSNVKLTDRIIDIERWYLQLDQALKQVEEQIVSATEAKKAVENANTKKFPFSVATKRCLDIRERRRDIDLVDDFLSNALFSESQYLDVATQQLRDKGTEIWHHLCTMKGIQDKLKNDMKRKGTAAKGDKHLRSMTLYSDSITLKNSPLEPAPSIITEMQWIDHSLQKKKEAEKEVQRGQDLVCAALSAIRHTDNGVQQHRERTQQAIRRRIHQVESARDVLQAQKEQLLQELPKLNNEVVELEKSLDSTRAPLKLAHTRLEKRKWYPRSEICSDGPRKSLREEVFQIESYKLSLTQKLQIARTALNELHTHLKRVEKDLALKEKVLELEKQSFEIHNHPHMGERDFEWIQRGEGAESEVPEVCSSTVMSDYSDASPLDIVYREEHTGTEGPKMRDSLTIRRRSAPSVRFQTDAYDLPNLADLYRRRLPSITSDSGTASSQLMLPDVIPVQSMQSLSEYSDILKRRESSNYIPSLELLRD